MKYEIEQMRGKYIVRAYYNNGYRDVSFYISKVKRDGSYEFMLDYTYAKQWANRAIAEKHMNIIKETNAVKEA